MAGPEKNILDRDAHDLSLLAPLRSQRSSEQQKAECTGRRGNQTLGLIEHGWHDLLCDFRYGWLSLSLVAEP